VVVCMRNFAAGYLGRGATELASARRSSARPSDSANVVAADVQHFVQKLLRGSCDCPLLPVLASLQVMHGVNHGGFLLMQCCPTTFFESCLEILIDPSANALAAAAAREFCRSTAAEGARLVWSAVGPVCNLIEKFAVQQTPSVLLQSDVTAD